MPPPPLPMMHAGVRLADAKSGVVPRFARGDHAEQRRARVALRIARVRRDSSSPSSARRVFDRRPAAPARRRGTGYVEASNSVMARVPLHAAADVVPEAVAAGAERRDDADAGDDDARRARWTAWRHYNTGRATDRRDTAVVARPVALGGLVFFVAALLYFAYRYTFVFGREQRGRSARAP